MRTIVSLTKDTQWVSNYKEKKPIPIIILFQSFRISDSLTFVFLLWDRSETARRNAMYC